MLTGKSKTGKPGTGYETPEPRGFRSQIPVYERVNLQLRAEAFNVLNHPNFGAPQGTPTSSAFGRVSGTTLIPRVMQLGVKVGW